MTPPNASSGTRVEMKNAPARTLIVRLSSLGDVIMATAALTAISARGEKADWLVAHEYSDLLRGHPAIGRVWEFDRRAGIRQWIKLCRLIGNSGYSEILDLHRTLRTKLLKAVLFRRRRELRIRTVSKQRIRTYLYYLFKRALPKGWRPSPYVRRFNELAGGTGAELGDLSYLVGDIGDTGLKGRKYICVMPSSRWPGKRWPAAKYAEVLARLPYLPVVLGAQSDEESHELVRILSKSGTAFVSGVGKWNLPKTASVLAGAVAYLGNDTGLSHLAEAVGARALTVLGPTVPDLGYGPNYAGSRALGMDLWCRPCSKDGRGCHRIFRPRLCLTGLEASKVLADIEETLR